MLTRKRAHSGATIKKMHGGEVFEAATLFPPGELPTKKQVIERMLNFPIELLVQQGMSPKKCMKDGYGVMSTHSITTPLLLKYKKPWQISVKSLDIPERTRSLTRNWNHLFWKMSKNFLTFTVVMSSKEDKWR